MRQEKIKRNTVCVILLKKKQILWKKFLFFMEILVNIWKWNIWVRPEIPDAITCNGETLSSSLHLILFQNFLAWPPTNYKNRVWAWSPSYWCPTINTASQLVNIPTKLHLDVCLLSTTFLHQNINEVLHIKFGSEKKQS